MRTTMTIEFKKRKKPEIEADLKHRIETETYLNRFRPKSISFGKKSYGQGENILTDHRSQPRIDNRRMQGKHEACKKCSGCGKGKTCSIL